MATLDLNTVVYLVLCFIVVKYGPLSLSSFFSPPFARLAADAAHVWPLSFYLPDSMKILPQQMMMVVMMM
jgi:hypothetical protein